MPFVCYGDGENLPRQLTPFWLVENLLEEEVTDILVINKSRQELYPLISMECRFTTLATNPIPELLEPGCQPIIGINDKILPINKFIAQICEEKMPQQTLPMQIMPGVTFKAQEWDDRPYMYMVYSDAPDFVFEKNLALHPQLGKLFARFKEIVDKHLGVI